MDVTLSIKNRALTTAIAVLMIATLLLIPLQAAGLSHGSRLMEIREAEEISGLGAARIESPDMHLARISAESQSVVRLLRVESPDMVLARVTPAETSAAAPVNTMFGVNIWAAALVLVLGLALVVALFSWERIFPVKENDVKRVTSRCTLVSESC